MRRRGGIAKALVLGALLGVVPTAHTGADARRPVRDLLPNVVVLPTRHVDSAFVCALIEIAEQGAQRCFRFSQTLANFGAGPLELRYDIEGFSENQQIRQRVYRTDGSVHDVFADRYEFHLAHQHFHYKAFAMSNLWQSDQSGALIGDEPLRTGRKNGFCIIDLDNQWAGTPESRERRYDEVGCQLPAVDGTESIEIVQGITPGWSDTYGATTEGQYIEVSGIPDGFYILQTIADPDDTLLEKSDRDNDAWTLVQFCGESTQLYPVPSGSWDVCASPA